MALIHHVVTGNGLPPVLFVHGFACAHTDWHAQVEHLSQRHQTVTVDLRAHGASPGTADACSIKGYAADILEVARALTLPAVLVGHSMGCRVVIEAAAQAPDRTAGLILVDGSQFDAVMQTVMQERFAKPDGYAAFVNGLFKDMFTGKSEAVTVASVVERARRLPRPVGEKLLVDLLRYDVECLTHALSNLHVPVMALQTTYSNERRERTTMTKEQNTPYLDMLRAADPSIHVEIIPDTGHFPQLDEPAQTNAIIDRFLSML